MMLNGWKISKLRLQNVSPLLATFVHVYSCKRHFGNDYTYMMLGQSLGKLWKISEPVLYNG